MAPEPVNDLRAGFHGRALSVGKLVFPCLCVMGFHPDRLASHHHLFLLVYYIVVQHTWHFHFVGLGTIGMQDHIAIRQELVNHGSPVSLSDGAWAW